MNSVELESVQIIAEFYRNRFQAGRGVVHVSALKVWDYNKACERGGVSVMFRRITGRWVFEEKGQEVDAYLHRRNSISESHCGVESIRLMNEDAASKFARRLAGRPPGANPHRF